VCSLLEYETTQFGRSLSVFVGLDHFLLYDSGTMLLRNAGKQHNLVSQGTSTHYRIWTMVQAYIYN